LPQVLRRDGGHGGRLSNEWYGEDEGEGEHGISFERVATDVEN
jgi:hypothetical protein